MRNLVNSIIHELKPSACVGSDMCDPVKSQKSKSVVQLLDSSTSFHHLVEHPDHIDVFINTYS